MTDGSRLLHSAVYSMCPLVPPTFSMEGPLWPVVLVQVYPPLLAQLAHLLVKLPGDVGVRCGDRSSDALGPKEPVDLGGGGEDAVVGSSPEHQAHVRTRQVEVTRCEKHGGVRPGVRQQALEG